MRVYAFNYEDQNLRAYMAWFMKQGGIGGNVHYVVARSGSNLIQMVINLSLI